MRRIKDCVSLSSPYSSGNDLPTHPCPRTKLVALSRAHFVSSRRALLSLPLAPLFRPRRSPPACIGMASRLEDVTLQQTGPRTRRPQRPTPPPRLSLPISRFSIS